MYSKNMVPDNEYRLFNKNYTLEECIKGIANREKQALVCLYEETKTAVYGFALSILKNSSDAEDVLQETFIKIYENADKYNSQGKPLAWVLTITKNLAYMKFRKQKNIDELNEEYKNIAIDDNDNIDDKILLKAAFKILSDEEINIVVLHTNDGFKHREIAKILDLPLSTVLSKYNRAIKKLKQEIGKEDIK